MLNLTVIQGRLTKDPDLKVGKTDKYASFTVACDKRLGKDKKETLFLDCYIFGKSAENLVEFKKKGDLITVQGELRQRSYESKGGEKHTVIELYASKIDFDAGQSAPKKEEKKEDQPTDFVPEE